MEKREAKKKLKRARYHNQSITIYNGDCREVLKSIDYGGFVLITDPPFGVNLGKASKKYYHKKWVPSAYNSYEDTFENFKELVPNVIKLCLEKCVRGIVFAEGKRITHLPPPTDVSVVFSKYSWGMTSLGFRTLDFFLFYGNLPNHFTGGARNKHIECTHKKYLKSKHPAAKCPSCMREIINRVSNPGDTILDPFCGGGAIAVAALQSGRKYVGIELDKDYFEMACSQVELALKKPNLIDIQTPARRKRANLLKRVIKRVKRNG